MNLDTELDGLIKETQRLKESFKAFLVNLDKEDRLEHLRWRNTPGPYWIGIYQMPLDEMIYMWRAADSVRPSGVVYLHSSQVPENVRKQAEERGFGHYVDMRLEDVASRVRSFEVWSRDHADWLRRTFPEPVAA